MAEYKRCEMSINPIRRRTIIFFALCNRRDFINRTFLDEDVCTNEILIASYKKELKDIEYMIEHFETPEMSHV